MSAYKRSDASVTGQLRTIEPIPVIQVSNGHLFCEGTVRNMKNKLRTNLL